MLIVESEYRYLSKADHSIKVFVNLFDHLFQSEVRLWRAEFLHHMLQLLKIDEFVSVDVITETQKWMMEVLLTMI